ncbi:MULTISPECIES: GntR family transcriptional regulator [unclassified Janibacter]|uniref:GntR family transcriptional regulator n=1 Tax=unclassified Janibacter TaxID=2649294 RepID=UPI003D00BDCE
MDVRPRSPGESSYRLLTQRLRERIFQGEFGEGSRMPTEHALATELGLSRQTIRRAYQDLVAEGLVYRVRGSGTFVMPGETRYRRAFGSIDDLMNLQLDTDFELVEPLADRIDRDAADRLRLNSPHVSSLVFQRLHRGTAFCRTRVDLPPAIAATLVGVPELTDPGVHTRTTIIGLIEARGNDIGEAEQVISATAAEAHLAAALGCPAGSPLLGIERLYTDRLGRPLELATSHFLPDHYSHRTRLSRRGDPQPGRAPSP